jgi:4-hydroxyphenylpyruvate dioxygenase
MSALNEVYYEMLEERLPGHGEPIDALQTRGILLDGSTTGGDKRPLISVLTCLSPSARRCSCSCGSRAAC